MHVTWELSDGRTITADVAEGTNLMEAALAAGVPRILGECGGNLACATCHVYVAPDWQVATGRPGDFEEAMLDAVEAPREATSRLSCQIIASAALDGLVLRVPG